MNNIENITVRVMIGIGIVLIIAFIVVLNMKYVESMQLLLSKLGS